MKRIERDYFLGEIIVPIQSQPTESRTIIRQSNGKSGKKVAPFLRNGLKSFSPKIRYQFQRHPQRVRGLLNRRGL